MSQPDFIAPLPEFPLQNLPFSKPTSMQKIYLLKNEKLLGL